MYYSIDYSRKTKTYYLYIYANFGTSTPESALSFPTRKAAEAKAKEYGLIKR